MSFLDSLENNLRALERQEERDPAEQSRKRAADEARKQEAEAIAPVAKELRRGKFTGDLMGALRTIGHERKIYVRITFVDETLRLEAKDHVLDLIPTAEGVVAEERFQDQQSTAKVDLNGDGQAFARGWLDSLPVSEVEQEGSADDE